MGYATLWFKLKTCHRSSVGYGFLTHVTLADHHNSCTVLINVSSPSPLEYASAFRGGRRRKSAIAQSQHSLRNISWNFIYMPT